MKQRQLGEPEKGRGCRGASHNKENEKEGKERERSCNLTRRRRIGRWMEVEENRAKRGDCKIELKEKERKEGHMEREEL